MGLLPFRCLFRQLAPLERSHCQQGASALSVRELGKPIALRRFAQAIFTGFHLPHPHPKEVLSDGPHGRTSSYPLPTKLDCLAAAPSINGPQRSAQKRVDRRTVGQCNLSGSATFRISGKPAALDGQQPRDLDGLPR
jgi:uncharacterized Zn-binding protein involved in type VI secretion